MQNVKLEVIIWLTSYAHDDLNILLIISEEYSDVKKKTWR